MGQLRIRIKAPVATMFGNSIFYCCFDTVAHLDQLDLIEGRRMDEDRLKNLNKQHLLEIADNYRSKTVVNLINVLGML